MELRTTWQFTARRLAIALLAAILTGCSYFGVGVTNIGDIVANPERFENKEVHVKGKVVDVNKMPFVELRYYTLRDDTGEITIVAGETLPEVGSTKVVRARVDTLAIVRGQALGLRLREVDADGR